MTALPTMLIMRGIIGNFPNPAMGGHIVEWPRGALDAPAAMEYARRRGYAGKVLDVDGATGANSKQVQACRAAFRADPTVTALYGFSGGGYNVLHILADLTAAERARLQLVVVLGAPGDPASLFKGPWELVYKLDPGHMDGPRALLGGLVLAHPELTATNDQGSEQNARQP